MTETTTTASSSGPTIPDVFPVRWLMWFFLPALAVCYRTAFEAAALSWNDSRYNYAMVALAVALVLLYQERDFLFPPELQQDKSGAILAGAAVALNLALTYLIPGVELYWRFLALALAWIGGLWYCHGQGALRAALFQVLMILASSPVPESWIHGFEVFLQYASADVSDAIFRLLSTPVYREGLVFMLPGLNIEVARECSGIRSTTALILVVAVCAHLLLQRGWSKVVLLLLTIPVGIIKNAVRIVILAWLGSNVSPEYLAGPLHRQGGPLFTLTAVALLGPTLWFLMRIERRQAGGRK